MKRRDLLIAAAGAGVAHVGVAFSQAYPSRTIELVVAYPSGGGTDLAARALARFMSPRLGGTIVVVNKSGASGELGFAHIARARPDGYTIGFINTPNVLTIPMERKAQYAMSDFAPIANVIDDPGGIFVAVNSPIRNVADLIERARAQPGRLTYATTGVGTGTHLVMLELERVANIKMTAVPYAGTAPIRLALMRGEVDVAPLNMGEGMPDARQGTFRPIGQTADKRWEGAPNVPTFREQNIDFVQGTLRGLVAPAGTPDDILQKLSMAVKDSMEDPEFQKFARDQLLALRYLGPREFAADLASRTSALQDLWRRMPWR
ncbi:MAG: tripartite tricarboxylate transporter substrate binding protein [Gammaproteobacteria bacterium]|nr:tripartite tricarboxylate transporter substrate binding protein [Gammaproteobacteria bacterium]